MIRLCSRGSVLASDASSSSDRARPALLFGAGPDAARGAAGGRSGARIRAGGFAGVFFASLAVFIVRVG